MILFLSNGSPEAGYGQRRAQRTTKTSTPPLPTLKEEKWWAAQRSIEAAIQQLETYLRENPNGARAATARQQLATLRSLSVSASRPDWVKMDTIGLLDIPEWRVASVEALAGKTRVVLEIRCDRVDGGDCHFLPFDRAPLVLVDNTGQYLPMLESTALPTTIKHRTDGQALITSGRIMNVTVDFMPLAPATVSGQIYYRDNNQARPAVFSFLGALPYKASLPERALKSLTP
jgi:hypothetical protein